MAAQRFAEIVEPVFYWINRQRNPCQEKTGEGSFEMAVTKNRSSGLSEAPGSTLHKGATVA
ncbi:hypothetical protein NPIL_618681, partial [Nephila pilipes]